MFEYNATCFGHGLHGLRRVLINCVQANVNILVSCSPSARASSSSLTPSSLARREYPHRPEPAVDTNDSMFVMCTWEIVGKCCAHRTSTS